MKKKATDGTVESVGRYMYMYGQAKSRLMEEQGVVPTSKKMKK